jgi:hypothetical protein
MRFDLMFRLSRLGSVLHARVMHCWALALLGVFALTADYGQAQAANKPEATDPTPQPAVSAILSSFDKYEVVAMPQGHGMQDLNDFILSLIRNPAFSEKVNDIEVEFGNSLYQPMLDRYIAGEDVSFTELQKVWRKMGQPASGASGFVEQFFPLVRAMNQKLPPERRLRVLAGDPAVDWDQIKGIQDLMARHFDRETSIASVMEKEVLSKHRKALMLFGTMHLMHGTRSAVSLYEKDYPNLTLVISELGIFDTDLPALSSSRLAKWPIPSLALAKGTWLGALDLGHFIPPPIRIDEKDCKVHHEFPNALQKPMEDLIDAFLYLGPQDLRLKEKIPADIALDKNYRAEFQRGADMLGFPDAASETSEKLDQQIVKSAEDPLFTIPKQLNPKDTQRAVQDCLERQKVHGDVVR